MKIDPSSKAAVAERVRIARRALGFTQPQLAAAIGAKLPTIKDYEAGKRIPGGRILGGFARAGVNVDWLLNDSGGPPLYSRSDAAFKHAVSESPAPDGAYEQMRRMRDSADFVRRIEFELGCSLPDTVGSTLASLVFAGQLTELGVREILAELKRSFQAPE